MRWLDSITDSMDMSLSKLRGSKGWEAWGVAVHGVAKSQTQLSDQNNNKIFHSMYISHFVYSFVGGDWTVSTFWIL